MIPGMATPSCSLTTGLVLSHKFNPHFFFSICFCSRFYIMGCASGIGSPQPHSAYDRSLSYEHIDYLSTSSRGGDNGVVVSDIVAYEGIFLAPASDMSKYSHFHLEELEIVIPDNVPLSVTLICLECILVQRMALINNLHHAIFLALIYYDYFVDIGVQPSSLPGATAATPPPPVATSIGAIATSSSTDHVWGP